MMNSMSAWGLGMTWTETSSPTFWAAAPPASVAALTAPTSPRTKMETSPPPGVLLAHHLHVGRLDHGVGGLDRPDQSPGFNHSQRLFSHLILPPDIYFLS